MITSLYLFILFRTLLVLISFFFFWSIYIFSSIYSLIWLTFQGPEGTTSILAQHPLAPQPLGARGPRGPCTLPFHQETSGWHEGEMWPLTKVMQTVSYGKHFFFYHLHLFKIFQSECFPSFYIITETDPDKWQVDRRQKCNVVKDITGYWKCKFLLTGDQKNKNVGLFLYFT